MGGARGFRPGEPLLLRVSPGRLCGGAGAAAGAAPPVRQPGEAEQHPSWRARRRDSGAERARGMRGKEDLMDLIWIIVIVLVVLALLGYFGRGRLR